MVTVPINSLGFSLESFSILVIATLEVVVFYLVHFSRKSLRFSICSGVLAKSNNVALNFIFPNFSTMLYLSKGEETIYVDWDLRLGLGFVTFLLDWSKIDSLGA